jgi:hypothetical protein
MTVSRLDASHHAVCHSITTAKFLHSAELNGATRVALPFFNFKDKSPVKPSFKHDFQARPKGAPLPLSEFLDV